MVVTYCVCERVSLAQVVAWAREHKTNDRRRVCEALKCGQRCRMCEPFIDYALATGQTEVPCPCPDLPGAIG